jgi:hypothetical protein
MLHWREYEFCKRIASGEDQIDAMKAAFVISKKESRERLSGLMSRADVQAMLDFLTGEMGKYDDDATRLVRLRQSAYDLACNEELKPSERASMMKEFSRLTNEIKKQQSRDEEANENVDALIRDLKGAKRAIESKETTDEESDQDDEEERQREGEGVLGESLLDSMFK